MLNHQDVGPHSGLVGTIRMISGIPSRVGITKDIHHRPTELALSQYFWSEVSHSLILIKYRYKTSFQFQARYQDIQGSYKSRELSRLTYCSVWQFTSEAWPAQFSRLPHGIKYLTSIQWALESILLWHPPQVFALGESIGTLSGWWDDP